MSIEHTYNHAAYAPGQSAPMYESYFLRANHPTRPLAFWIRYTLFVPAAAPDKAIGELWAIWFDGETNKHVAVRQPHDAFSFRQDGFAARIANSTLGPGALKGEAAYDGATIAWDLKYRGAEPPLFLLPRELYSPQAPMAKSLVALPLATFAGSLTVNGERHDIDDWIGSQNHNWGPKHTDQYAYGQVSGFDGAPGVHFEAVSARNRMGDQWTPQATSLIVRIDGREHALNGLPLVLQAKSSVEDFTWRFSNENDDVRIEGFMRAPREAFVGLGYLNPPGGLKHCLNTKIARCEIEVTEKATAKTETYVSAHGGLFEIIPPETDGAHGIPIIVNPEAPA